MRHTRARGKQIAIFAIAVLFSVAVTNSPASAQAGGGRTYSVGRRIDAMERQADEYERDGLHRDREKKTETVTDRKRVKSIAVQVAEDFGKIQDIYNELVRTMVSGKTLDQVFLSESVSGINRCAGRLKSNLALPELKEKGKDHEKPSDINEERLKGSLTILLNHISNFVTNPLFESTGVLNVELSTRASRDLNEIIELSNSIRKSIEKVKPSQ